MVREESLKVFIETNLIKEWVLGSTLRITRLYDLTYDSLDLSNDVLCIRTTFMLLFLGEDLLAKLEVQVKNYVAVCCFVDPSPYWISFLCVNIKVISRAVSFHGVLRCVRRDHLILARFARIVTVARRQSR